MRRNSPAYETPERPRNDADLQKIRTSLETLSIPSEYQQAWSQKQAVLRRNQWLQDAQALEGTIKQLCEDYQKFAEEGDQIRQDSDKPGRLQKAKELLDKASSLPDPTRDHDKTIQGSTRITYADVFQFDRVTIARSNWLEIHRFLEKFVKAFDKPT